MLGIGRRRLLPVAGALVVAATGCREKPVPVEELFTTRTQAMQSLRRGQLPEAEAQFRKLVALAPDDPLGYANLGLTYLQQGRLDEARAQLERARKLDPASAEVALMLAKLHSLSGRRADAESTLQELLRRDPKNLHALYALATLDSGTADAAALARREQRMRDILALSPANVVTRLELAELFVRRGAADSAVRQLEEVRRIPPAPPKEAQPELDRAIQALRAGKLDEARGALQQFARAMELTKPYQASLDDVKWIEGPIAGTPLLSFAPTYLISVRGIVDRPLVDSVRFADVTDNSGLLDADGGARGPAAAAVAPIDVDGDGRDELLVSAWSGAKGGPVARVYQAQGGFVRDATPRTGISLGGGVVGAAVGDYDNDGWLDLFAIGGDRRGHLLHNGGSGRFDDVAARARVADVGDATKALFVDLDHDGDLDLLLVGPTRRVLYRNNLDGTFTDATAELGLSGAGARDAAFGDFDGDGRVDLLFLDAAGSVSLYYNGGAQRFGDATTASGLAVSGAGAIAVGDYDNDGALDLVVASASGGEPTLWRNDGSGHFAADRAASAGLRALRGVRAAAAQLLDYDNDGWLDLLVVGTPAGTGAAARGAALFHNDGGARFTDRSERLPATLRAVAGSAIAVADVDDDGDEDLLVADAGGGVHLLRNDGGNGNMAVRVQLKGLRTGSGKNNDFGVGARVELRTGEIYQTRVVTGRVTHFGLGPHLKADVLRVEWPNGVPQTVYFPGSDQDVVEYEMLKGSCAFAYTWDGTRFRFVTDVMWRSALGMPMGLMSAGGGSAFAPAGASQEYLRIPGSALRPKDGRYLLRFTEELWETAYADEIKLLAVDHPDSVDVFVDERFVPPGPVSLRLFQAARRWYPRSAVDERGADVLAALRASDDVYVSNLTPTRYQGVVEPHDLVLDLGDEAGAPGTHLFLRGWIYPTDASINVALSQQKALAPAPPSLEVRDARGRWTTAVAQLGFPSGKDKTMVIDLAGRFPTRDHHVRIRTSMQIYWDEAFVSRDAAASPVRVTTLEPTSATLRSRGYSRTYRKGGRYGPFWFDYDDVSTTAPWRPITGAFTRFGDVLPLLGRPDDMYVVMGPGDETAVEFDASSERALPKGWRRDFLLYTDGWIKDSDLNTAFGTTVEPLPFHGIRAYPYAAGDAYPSDPAHQRYLREYQTRIVTRRAAPAVSSAAAGGDRAGGR